MRTLASRLSTSTSTTMSGVDHLLDSCSKHPDANIRYYTSDMQLKIHSDASYLSEPKAKSRIGGYFYLGNAQNSPLPPLTYGPLLCHYTVLKHWVSSMADAEFGSVCVNTKIGTVTRTTLTEMGHPQEATYLKTDNSTTDGIINKTVQQKLSKAMDMRCYWIQDRVEQGQFDMGWAVGDTTMGDYLTKHHPPTHHKCIRQYYLHSATNPIVRHNSMLPVLQACVNICTCTISRPTITHAPTRYGRMDNSTGRESHYSHIHRH
jgi:hypothetical protein